MNAIFSIVVTYNGMQWIDKCLNSLLNSQMPTEIVVVENGSTDGTREYVKYHYPGVHVLELSKNLGFGKANNLGIDYAIKQSAEFVFLLNQDAWIEADTLHLLWNCMTANPKLGIVSPIHLNGNGKAMDIYFGNYLQASDTKEFLTNVLLKSIPFRPYINTQFVNAAAWLISRQCIVNTGGFDPIFFHYGEDRNYAQRVLFWGFEIGILPRAFIFHDREERILRSRASKQIDFKKEWDNFLNHACDIHRNNTILFVVKRFFRHFLQAMKNAATLNGNKLSFDLFMIKKIASSVFAISACRKRSRLRHSDFIAADIHSYYRYNAV